MQRYRGIILSEPLDQYILGTGSPPVSKKNSTQHLTGSYLEVSYVVSWPEDIDLK